MQYSLCFIDGSHNNAVYAAHSTIFWHIFSHPFLRNGGSPSWCLFLSMFLCMFLLIWASLLIGQKVVSRTNRRTVSSHVTWKNEDDLPTNSVLKVSGQVVFIKLLVTWHHTVLSLVDQTVWCQLSAPELGLKNIYPGWSYEPMLPTLYTQNKARRFLCKFKYTM